jgi:hypothetical protein
VDVIQKADENEVSDYMAGANTIRPSLPTKVSFIFQRVFSNAKGAVSLSIQDSGSIYSYF